MKVRSRHTGCWHIRIDFFSVASLRETFFLKQVALM